MCEGVALHLYDNDVAAGQSAELEISRTVIDRYHKDPESMRDELMRIEKLSELIIHQEESPKVPSQPDQYPKADRQPTTDTRSIAKHPVTSDAPLPNEMDSSENTAQHDPRGNSPARHNLRNRSNYSVPERHLGQSPDFASFSREVQAI
jgi:hypothetical protein